ncbi:MAG: hypothetical protein IT382_08640 [Deltaproteobacteria bacterium]|nr:hypothetical protein [Deltaproteobacteria bacterium]
MARPGPLLRLVSTLDRRRGARGYQITLTLRRAGSSAPLATARQATAGPRGLVVGAGERVDLAVPSSEAAQLMPRHLAVVALPRADGVLLRAVSLHPERELAVVALSAAPDTIAPGPDAQGLGGAVARGGMRLLFDGFSVDLKAELENPPADGAPGSGAAILELYPLGQQLSFFAGSSVRAVGDVVSSVAGPDGGGHAIPALVSSQEEPAPAGGTLLLRTRLGVHRVEVSDAELRRGLLIGRSRRCVLGRGFDENDGLSRVHALVIALDDGVYAFDLASRYGLRDVSRPSRLVQSSRLDDGVGCLVYGAGHLTFEP